MSMAASFIDEFAAIVRTDAGKFVVLNCDPDWFRHAKHYDAKDCDCDQTRRARDGIVHSRCGPSAVLRDRAHNGRGQRRYGDCHA